MSDQILDRTPEEQEAMEVVVANIGNTFKKTKPQSAKVDKITVDEPHPMYKVQKKTAVVKPEGWFSDGKVM